MRYEVGDLVYFYFNEEILSGVIIKAFLGVFTKAYYIETSRGVIVTTESEIIDYNTSIFLRSKYDLRDFSSDDVYQRLHGIGAYANNMVILEQSQITTEIIELARARGIKIEVLKRNDTQEMLVNGNFVLQDTVKNVIDEFLKFKEVKKLDTNLFPNYNLGFNPFDNDTIKISIKRENLPNTVFFNDKKKATTLMFGKEATVVKCGKDDEYSRRIGFLEAYFQATCGLSKTKAKKYLENIVKDKEEKK